jgi:hypothetical protein
MPAYKKTSKRILIDTLGWLLIVTAGLVGWLPGPAGIPLFVAGLSLLAIHNDWAANWLKRFRKEGKAIVNKLFDGNARVQLALDVLGLGFTILGVIGLVNLARLTQRSAALSITAIGISILLTNRHRFRRLRHRLKR